MRRTWIHIVLFILTVASTWVTVSLSYCIAIMLILLGHEMGHYFMSRRNSMMASLPFFLPLPIISPFGTLGAIIRMEGSLPSRKAIFDTGVAGPLISFLLSTPAIYFGLKLSETIPASQVKGEVIRLADPLLFSLLQGLVMGSVPSNYEVMVHPIAYAGWVGLFVTAFNLLPVGQLDGGHVAYALFGKKSRNIFAIAIGIMAFIFVFYSIVWFLPLVLMVLFGLRHPIPSDDQTPLDMRRKLIGGLVFLFLILSFTPSPFPEAPSLIKIIEKGSEAFQM
jgi:membrane-associated protease RseP (regulator of RpoE activity)